MGIVLGIKNQKGTVSVENFKNRIRLRWRYQGKRYSLSLGPYDKLNLKAAKKVVMKIELDMADEQFDQTLVKYGGKAIATHDEPVLPTTIVANFEKWVKEYKQMDCDKDHDYFHLRNKLLKWGQFGSDDILSKHNSEQCAPKTYNNRLSMLKLFASWMVKQGRWAFNPFDGVSRRKVKKTEKQDRVPFTEEEIRLILDAIKHDRICPASSRYKIYCFINQKCKYQQN
jgi:integrase